MLTFKLINVDGETQISGDLNRLRKNLQDCWVREHLNDPVWKGRDDVVCLSIMMGDQEVAFLEQEETRQFLIQLLVVR